MSGPLIQRIFELFVALVSMVLSAPLLATVAAAIYLEDGGPVFFVQKRIGQGGQLFPCIKFRSMRQGAAEALSSLLATDPEIRREWEEAQKLRFDPRVTRVGAILRRYSLDELPQLFNVLLGHMELVGPRPIVPDEVRRYGRRFGSYCAVKPGLTGLWQVSGRSDVSYRRRVAIDVIYARKKTPALDMQIIAATVPAVLLSRGSW